MENPNIVMIVIDAFRPRHLSMFGYKKETDKNLKNIAKESILFRSSFSSSNSTAPSLNSIFTGLYPPNHGVIHQFPYATELEITKFEDTAKFWLPSFLKDKGYETMAIDWIGLWYKNGFDYYEEKKEGRSRLKKFMNIPFVKKIMLNLPNWAYKLGKRIVKTRASTPFVPASQTAELAISKIKQSKKPFFLFAHFWDTHFPYPTTNFKGSGKQDTYQILDNIKAKSQKEYVKKRITDINLFSTEDIINKYDKTLMNIDKEVGKIVKALKKESLWSNTLFILLGDHGDSLTEHGIYFSHSGLFDESIHVPMIIHFPGIEAKEIDEFVQNTDITPTILDFLNEKTEYKFDGKSILPLAKNSEKIHDKVFSWDGLSGNIKSVRTKNRKLIVAEDNSCNLCKASHHKKYEEYDLLKDPGELKNIYSENSELMPFMK